MVERTMIIECATGMHARPAGLLTKQAQKFKSKTVLIHKDLEIEAKSILNIMAAGIGSGAEITLRCDGEDELHALEALASVIEGLKE